jgi:hypothetical protein
MADATYIIVRLGKTWAIEHNEQREGEYATKEAAFEAAAAAASNAIKEGLGVTIRVPHRASGESALGTDAANG